KSARRPLRNLRVFDQVQPVLVEGQDEVVHHLWTSPFVRKIGADFLERDIAAGLAARDQDRQRIFKLGHGSTPFQRITSAIQVYMLSFGVRRRPTPSRPRRPSGAGANNPLIRLPHVTPFNCTPNAPPANWLPRKRQKQPLADRAQNRLSQDVPSCGTAF